MQFTSHKGSFPPATKGLFHKHQQTIMGLSSLLTGCDPNSESGTQGSVIRQLSEVEGSGITVGHFWINISTSYLPTTKSWIWTWHFLHLEKFFRIFYENFLDCGSVSHPGLPTTKEFCVTEFSPPGWTCHLLILPLQLFLLTLSTGLPAGIQLLNHKQLLATNLQWHWVSALSPPWLESLCSCQNIKKKVVKMLRREKYFQ